MSEFREVVIWAAVLVILVVYARTSGLIPANIGTLTSGSAVLGQSSSQNFGELQKDK